MGEAEVVGKCRPPGFLLHRWGRGSGLKAGVMSGCLKQGLGNPVDGVQ